MSAHATVEALRRGDRTAVAEALAADPGFAAAPVGDPAWLPLVHVTHSPALGGEDTDALVACAALLLDAGADPDAAWQHPEFGALSALYGAAGVAHEPRMTALLLERGATPDDGESLYHACETRDHTCLRLLLDAGARVEGTNAVAHMLDFDDLDGLRLLLDRGAASGELRGAVGHAVLRDRSPAHVELLLGFGAPAGEREATLAVRRGRPDLAGLLGPGVPSPADELVGAIRRGDRAACDGLLAAHPGLLDSLGRDDHDVLVHSAALGDVAAARIMLDLGFPVDVRSEEFEETPLHAAAWYGRADMAALLLEHGAEVATQAGPPFGGTPIEWAHRGAWEADPSVFGLRAPAPDHERTVKVLLGSGAG